MIHMRAERLDEVIDIPPRPRSCTVAAVGKAAALW